MQDLSVEQEIFTRLDAVAAKIGVATEHLWEVWTNYAFAESIASITSLTGAVFLAFFISSLFKKLSRKYKDANDKPNEALYSWYVFFVVATIGVATAWLVNIPTDIAMIYSPEVGAWRELRGVIK
jgi:hypothetical protein